MTIPTTLFTQILKLLYQFYNEPVDPGDIKARERRRKVGNIIKKLKKLK